MSETDIRSRIDDVFSRFDTTTPGCAVSIIHESQVVLRAGYGNANLEHAVPIVPSTVFHVASLSKQFTCFAILLLAERGSLNLDDDIRSHIPELHDFGSTVTIRHLCHHTSGIRDQWTLLNIAGWRPDDVITKEHILKLLYRQEDLNFPPGEAFLYCNSGYSLLAEICERVTDGTFRAFVDAEILEPLGMTQTHIHDDHQEIVPGRADSYERKKDGYVKSILSFSNHGATSLFTTVEDLAVWILNFEAREFGGSVIEQMQQQGKLNNGETIDYAFGLTHCRYRDAAVIQHSGSDAGFRSHLLMIPEHRFGVAVLANVGDANPGALAHSVVDIVLESGLGPVENQPASAQQGDTSDNEESISPDCLGVYVSPELQTRYEILSIGGKIIARHHRHPDISLTCSAPDELTGDASYFKTLCFHRNKSGAVTGFLLTSGRVRNLRFDRVTP